MFDRRASWRSPTCAWIAVTLWCAAPACAADVVQQGRAAISAKNYAKALDLLRLPAEHGNPVAQNALGVLYANGWGVAQDHAQALSWFRRAAEQNEPKAQYSLGSMYLRGAGVNQDYSEAVKWFRKAAEQNGPEAQYALGAMYADGLGVSKDFSEAARWFRKAADQGLWQAQAALGTLHGRGDGVPQDFAAAMARYRQAAEQGDADAQGRLGQMYLNGEGAEKNLAEAERWLRRSALQGHPRGQFGLGQMHLSGRGVDRNFDEAAKWLRSATEKWPLMTGLDEKRKVGLPNVQDGGTEEEQDAYRLLRAVSVPPEALAQSHLAVSYQLRFAEHARLGVNVITTIDGRPESIDKSNADRYVARYDKRLSMYSAAIRQRGFQRIAGEYDAAVHERCSRVGLLAGKVVLEQEDFRVSLRHEPFSALPGHRGVVVESALVVEHAMDPRIDFIGSVAPDRIELRNDSTGCVVTLTRR